MPEIDYESDGFSTSGPVSNGSSTLAVTWHDLLWAAITVGRPGRYFVFRHGTSSLYEALFRLSALRMTVEQSAPTTRRLRRTAAAKSLDPSEKGAINYFLGLTLCKLFVDIMLDAPLLLHLDVFRSRLNPVLLTGRSRPDLIGRPRSGEWVALESKGRVSPPTCEAKTKAKQQALRILTIQGKPVSYQIGAFAYFKDDVLRFFWRDPKDDGTEPPNPIRLDVPEEDVWRAYYKPILQLLGPEHAAMIERENIPIPINEADLKVRVLPQVMTLLRLEKWKDAGEWCLEHPRELSDAEVHGDGVQVVAGESWLQRFQEEAE